MCLVFFLVACARAPAPFDASELGSHVQSDVELLASDMKETSAPITLYEAIARALKYNRERKLAAMEAALVARQLDLAQFDMLPELTASAGYSDRDKYLASASTTFNGDTPVPLSANPTYTVAQDKERTARSVTFSWNILDFGLSYVRAGQQGDRYLIAGEKIRKVRHNIVRDVRVSYWQAVAAQNLIGKLAPLLVRIDQAIADSQRIERARLSPPVDALTYQKSLLDIRRTMHEQMRRLTSAETDLKRLMGMLPATQIELADMPYDVPQIDVSLSDMEIMALTQRPEVIEARYQDRISRSDVRAAMLDLLPGIRLNASYNYEDSDYARYEESLEISQQISFNLFNVFRASSTRGAAKNRVEISNMQRLAVSMAVLSQVHISNMDFALARNEFQLAETYFRVTERLLQQQQAASTTASGGELSLIRREADFLLARLRRDVAFADVQNSYGAIQVSIGRDLLPTDFADKSLAGMAQAIEATLAPPPSPPSLASDPQEPEVPELEITEPEAPTAAIVSYIQIQALSKQARAQAYAAATATKYGRPVEVRKTLRLQPPLYRVLVTFSDWSELRSALATFKGDGLVDAYITRN